MTKKLVRLFFIIGCFWSSFAVASTHDVPLLRANIDLHDKTAVQRGAKYFMNYCAGCHSLKYMRYNRLAKDARIFDEQDNIASDLIQNNIIFTGVKIGEPMENAISKSDAKEWFGIVPPDLTLAARVRGADWLYSFLNSFYVDPNRPFGTNNWIFDDVAMPNVLANLQGEQIAVYRTKRIPYGDGTKEIQVIDHLQLLEAGSMTQQQFASTVKDIVSFLVYVAEPIQLKRRQLGIWVLLFLFLLLPFAYFLKKEFWKDIK